MNNLTRRTILALSSAAVSATVVNSVVDRFSWVAGMSSHLDRLRARVRGRVLLPGDPGYDLERSAWNLHIDSQPRVIVAAETPRDVVAAVRFAGAERLPIAVQATGHGQGHESDGAVLVSTRALTELSIDPNRRVARVGPGVLWRAVVDAGAPYGLAPPNGSTSLISAVGYLSGGGLPVLGRRYGYGVDHMRSVDLVTADGCRRRVTTKREPELFWAVRGGGGNFGIVTAAEVELVAQPRFYGGGLFFPGVDARGIVSSWLAWTARQPEEMGTSLALIRFPDQPETPESIRGRFMVHVRIAYAGNVQQGERLVRPLRALSPVVDTIADRPYTQIDEVHQDPTQPLPVVELSSLMGHLDHGFVEQLMAVAGPDVTAPPDVVEVRLLGGALARPAAVPSALGHRDAPFTLLLGAFAPPGRGEPALAGLHAALASLETWSTGAVFPNFLGSSGHGDPARVRKAYEPDDYVQLARLKARHDPDNMFRINHNIPPATT
jgi:hypothetical protein